jgi:hypothetical protein
VAEKMRGSRPGSISALLRAYVLILDELGFVPSDRAGGELPFKLITNF